MPTLSRREIIERLSSRTFPFKLVVTPIFEMSQIADGAVDLRLGTEFIIINRTEFPALDFKKKKEIEENVGKYQSKVWIEFGKPFVLHPSELILGSTLEYIVMPRDLFGYVLTRSRWGRLGLIIATASAVNPGFKGSLTLELINHGEVPLVLYPGFAIAQLILHTSSEGEYTGAYKCPTGPEFSKAYEDPDISFWTNPYQKKKNR